MKEWDTLNTCPSPLVLFVAPKQSEFAQPELDIGTNCSLWQKQDGHTRKDKCSVDANVGHSIANMSTSTESTASVSFFSEKFALPFSVRKHRHGQVCPVMMCRQKHRRPVVDMVARWCDVRLSWSGLVSAGIASQSQVIRRWQLRSPPYASTEEFSKNCGPCKD